MKSTLSISEIHDQLQPIFEKARNYRFNPVEHPHRLSEDDLAQLELLHYQIETALWRIQYGALDEKLETHQITHREFIEESDNLSERKHPYRSI